MWKRHVTFCLRCRPVSVARSARGGEVAGPPQTLLVGDNLIWFRVPCCHPPPHGMVPPPLPPYLIHFAHATVAKRTFPYFCMHAAVAKRTFSFCWMNPPAGFGGSIARNCGEMQILSSRNCSAQCTGHFNAQQMESYTYTYPCTYTFININNYICKNIYVYLHIHICTYPFHHIHIHIDIFIYT